jgi:protein-S-isoprenylcysteine O-methyltransferase Ste14
MHKTPKILPPVYFLAAIALMVILDRWIPLRILLRDASAGLGWILVFFGGISTIGAAGLFRRLGTPVKPFEPSTVLVTRGFFRFTRNPMYLGMVLALVGLALILGSLSAFLPVPLFIWWIQSRFIRREEEFLEGIFGDAYRQYKSKVRRWF